MTQNVRNDSKSSTKSGSSIIFRISMLSFEIIVLIVAVWFANAYVMGPCRTFSLPSQKGKTIVVTGASSGLGLETARVLAEKGAKVIMGCRSINKCERAKKEAKIDSLDAQCMALEMSSLSSVRDFATKVKEKQGDKGIDVLINNAGLMNVQPYQTTEEGFEMTMGVNHYGHFLLTQLLLPVINANGRVVTHSSMASHLTADRFPFTLLPKKWTTEVYNGWLVYGNSKLANAYMSWELSLRLQESESPRLRSIRSYVVHPGYTSTNLQAEAGMIGYKFGNSWVGMHVEDGVLTQLAAAASEEEEYTGASTPDVMIGPAAQIVGYPKATKTGLFDAVRTFQVWEKSLVAVGITREEDAAPADVDRAKVLGANQLHSEIPL